jgi:hypothetical protein
VTVAVLVLFVGAARAVAQTTSTQAPSTTTSIPVTSPPTAAPTAAPTSTVPVTSTTPPATTNDSSDDDFPWLIVLLGALALGVIIFGVAALSRDRARRHARVAEWRRRAAYETSEIGATARLLAAGAPVSAAMAQQVVTSLRNLDELSQSAPSDDMRSGADRARQAVHALGVAIDAYVSARRTQPALPQEQLDAASASLQNTATEADTVLRSTNHAFTS